MRRLHLSKAVVNAPLPNNVEFLSLSECSLWPAAFPKSRLDVATQTLTLPRLRELELLTVELQTGAMVAVPHRVERLRIKNTILTYESYEGLDQSDVGLSAVSRMAEIDLSDSTTLTDYEVVDITTTWPHISTLKLNGCINTTFDPSYSRDIFENLGQYGRLEVLEANGVPFSDDDIDEICWYVGGTLRRFSVAGCPLTDHSAARIATDLISLQSLDVSSCGQLTDRCFIVFASLRATLSFLNVSSTNVTNATIGLLRLCMPQCQIIQ